MGERAGGQAAENSCTSQVASRTKRRRVLANSTFRTASQQALSNRMGIEFDDCRSYGSSTAMLSKTPQTRSVQLHSGSGIPVIGNFREELECSRAHSPVSAGAREVLPVEYRQEHVRQQRIALGSAPAGAGEYRQIVEAYYRLGT